MDSWTCSPSTHESMLLCSVEFQQSTSRSNVLKEGGHIPASLEELDIAFHCIIAPLSPNEWINKPISSPIYSFPLAKSANFRSVTKMNPEKLKKWTPGNRFSSLNKWKELKSHGFFFWQQRNSKNQMQHRKPYRWKAAGEKKKEGCVLVRGQRRRSPRTDKTFSRVTSRTTWKRTKGHLVP